MAPLVRGPGGHQTDELLATSKPALLAGPETLHGPRDPSGVAAGAANADHVVLERVGHHPAGASAGRACWSRDRQWIPPAAFISSPAQTRAGRPCPPSSSRGSRVRTA